jgi:hypothetical protein
MTGPKIVEGLIDRSSLGTPHATAMRASISEETAQRVVRQSQALSKLMRVGFTEEQAWALARRDYDDVVGFVDLGGVLAVLGGGT